MVYCLFSNVMVTPWNDDNESMCIAESQGSKLTVASSKFVTLKSHLPPVKNVGSKKLLPGNSVLKVISWKNKPIFPEIILLFMTKHNSIWSKALLSHKSDNGL